MSCSKSIVLRGVSDGYFPRLTRGSKSSIVEHNIHRTNIDEVLQKLYGCTQCTQYEQIQRICETTYV